MDSGELKNPSFRFLGDSPSQFASLGFCFLFLLFQVEEQWICCTKSYGELVQVLWWMFQRKERGFSTSLKVTWSRYSLFFFFFSILISLYVILKENLKFFDSHFTLCDLEGEFEVPSYGCCFCSSSCS